MKTNTEKAIEFLNDCQDDYEELQEEGNNKGILEVIKLLEKGEKYKKMWGELEKEWGWCTTHYRGRTPDGGYTGHNESIKEIMDRVKQKYFPKPKSNLVRLIKEIDKTVKEILEEIK